MSNLLMPVGVPTAAYTKMKPNRPENPRQFFPCISNQNFGRSPMFDPQGPMPDVLESWIQAPKGTRHLQAEELAKAKGVPKEWQPTSRKKRTGWRTIVGLVTVVHLWTAAMDPLGLWMRSRSPLEPQKRDTGCDFSKTELPLPTAKWKDSATDASEWKVPDLGEGSDWCKARVHSLCLAIQNWPNKTQHLSDGIQALGRHRTNYSPEGPQQLQSLWWEFPEEHWET
jgi:hypothetical protein